MSDVVNLKEKLSMIQEQWSPRIVAQMNDYHLKIAKIQGEFVWHTHAETDEVFMVIDGEMEIHTRNEVIAMQAGEIYVVAKGVEHKPVAEKECSILMVEPAGTMNTGDAGGKLTVDSPDWI
ncbi:MAG: cupin domain-containing protein [Anaerolineaceae bacterium]|nr:cupin domain-containing protein [Anaerolineaceae bacterium]